MYNLVIVDDELYECQSLASLPWDNFNISVGFLASNGFDAYEYIKDNKVDIVITDIKMPVMNGLELIEKLRANFPDIVIIVLSGFDSYDYVRFSFKNNVFDYLLKPINLENWQTTMRDVVSKINGSEDNLFKLFQTKSHLVHLILDYIQNNFSSDITLTSAATHIHTNPTYLSRTIKKELGKGFSDILNLTRIEHAKKLLKNTNIPITEVALMVGYTDSRYFSNIFKKSTGISPFQFRRS